MGGDVRVTASLALMVLVVALATVGCSASSTTPNGYPCSNKEDNCYYFISDGTVQPCDVGIINFCKNTPGSYYDYLSLDHKTYRCVHHYGCLGVGMHAVSVPTPQLCSRAFKYSALTSSGQAWQVVNRQTDQNSTDQPVTTRFVSNSATTVTASASIHLSASADAILGVVFASVHAQVNASVTRVASTVVGNAVSVHVPAGATANAIYGVKVQITRGHLYQSNSCGPGKRNYGVVRTYVPISPGWCVWLSGQPPCRVVGSG
jgi:hypothetical protein